MSEKRYYTASDVDALIPELEEIFQHIEVCKNRAVALAGPAFMAPEPRKACDIAQLQVVRSQVEFLMEAVEMDVQQIEALGGITKDIETGLVDFLGDVEGRDVWLCWKKGEKNVRFWHPLDAGYAQRQALPVSSKKHPTLMANTPDRQQFEKEAFPYLDEIFASAMRFTRQRENAEDLVSEVYTRAWKAYGNFEKGTNMRAWLYKILTNTFINHYRHKQRQPGIVNLDQPHGDGENSETNTLYDRLADTAPRPDEILTNRFLDRDLKAAIDSLPEEFRMVVTLCDVQSFSYQDAADMLEIPIGTVRSRLFRGRRLLQKALWDQAVATGVVSATGGQG